MDRKIWRAVNHLYRSGTPVQVKALGAAPSAHGLQTSTYYGAYHPIANGIIERFHRQLKAAIKAQELAAHWTQLLPMVLLGIRTALKTDLQCSVAELVYGTTLRLPGEFSVQHTSSTPEDTAALLTHLRAAMRELKATAPRYQPRGNTYISDELSTCTHVFVRNDAVRKPLRRPYNGPFRVGLVYVYINRCTLYMTCHLIHDHTSNHINCNSEDVHHIFREKHMYCIH